MNNNCYTLAIRQSICENGIRREVDNVYTNVAINAIIPLSFGYSITFISSTSNVATIQISNIDTIPNIIFNIPNGGYKIFDLPVESCTLRVYIGATAIACSDPVICCCTKV